jgi:hypothetical protein
MLIDVETPRQRVVEALETLGREFGVSEDVRAVEGAEDWRDEAIAMPAGIRERLFGGAA